MWKAECISFPKMYRFVYVPQLYNKQQHYILTTLVFAISRSILTLNDGGKECIDDGGKICIDDGGNICIDDGGKACSDDGGRGT